MILRNEKASFGRLFSAFFEKVVDFFMLCAIIIKLFMLL